MSDLLLIIGVILVIAVLIGFVIGFIIKSRRRPAAAGPRDVKMVSNRYTLEARRQRLLMEMAELDDAYESGKIPEKEYLNQKVSKKSELDGVIANISQSTSSK